VTRINEALLDAPETVNGDPYGKGWMIVLETAGDDSLDSLLSAGDYEAYVAAEKGA
jgi:glycine cleavage system H protein